MAKTQVGSGQIGDGQVKRADLNATDSGDAVVRKIVQGTGISLSSTGPDPGTGDVTINATASATSLNGLSDVDTAGANTGDALAFDGAIGDGTWVPKPAVLSALFDANTILKADANDTPEALTVGEQTLVGRITGGEITALTPAQVRTLVPRTIRIGHGFAIKGTAANGEIPGFFVSLPTGQTAKIVAAEHATESGTVTAQVRKNGTALTDLTALSVTSTPTLTDEDPDVSLANRDYIDINLSSASTPADLRITVFVEYTV